MKATVIITVMIVLPLFMAETEGAVDCKLVEASVNGCIPFLLNGVGPVTPACCKGLRDLKKMTPSTPDIRAACSCLKLGVLIRNPKIKPDAVKSLPAKCGIQIDLPISTAVDCSK